MARFTVNIESDDETVIDRIAQHIIGEPLKGRSADAHVVAVDEKGATRGEWRYVRSFDPNDGDVASPISTKDGETANPQNPQR